MVLLNIDIVVVVYLICHSPAIITLIIGLNRLKTKPKLAKRLLIFSAIYFVIGAGICGSLFLA